MVGGGNRAIYLRDDGRIQVSVTVREIIYGMIDVTGVPPEKRKGKDYEDARELIHDELPSVKAVEIACYHEAAHWVYAIIGAHQFGVDGALFRVVGPSIKYFSAVGERPEYYEETATCLDMGEAMKNWKAQGEEDVKTMARIAVAGGEAVSQFYGPDTRRRDDYDKCVFTRFCEEVHDRVAGIGPSHIYLEAALDEVRADFAGVIRPRVASYARTVKKEVFGPVFDS